MAMTKAEKKHVADLIERVNDLAVGMTRKWCECDGINQPAWWKDMYWQRYEPKRKELEAQVKELTGKYVPLG